ncbi:hypothetical protein Q427_18015 [Halomonas sp. BC04]|nr:hypothetical protein Q427_18015 [Halomonas sp. BC04]
MNTREYQALDRAHHLHPFTDFKALGEEGSRIVTRAEGVYIHDSEGNRILDGMAGLWCVNLGYGREELVEAASAQLRELPYYNNFFKSAHPPAVELAEALCRLAPAHMNRVFFTGSGSEANDTALRMVRRYWQLEGKPDKQWIISRENAYHGSTVAGLSLGGMAPMQAQGGPLVPKIAHVRQPYWFGEGREMNLMPSVASVPRPSRPRFTSSARRTSPPSSPSPCRVREVPSSHLPATGRR